MADPWAKFRVGAAPAPVAGPSGNDPVIAPADPYKQAAEIRANRDQQLQEQANARAAAAADRAAAASERQAAAQDRQVQLDAQGKEFQAKSASFYGRMLQSQQEYGTVGGDNLDPRGVIRQTIHDNFPNVENQFLNEPTRQRADQAARNFIAAQLRLESGAAISQQEYDNQYRIFFPMPGDTPEVIAQKARARQQATEAMKLQAGPLADATAQTLTPVYGQQGANAAPPVIGGGNDTPPQMEAATGDTRRVENPELTARLDQLIRKGAPLTAINTFLTAQGASPIAEGDYAKVRDFLSANPGYEGSVAKAWKLEPIGAFERAVTQLGNNPVGAYFVNAGQFLSGNTLDNLTADPARARASFDVISAQNPNAAAVGQVSGGILGSMGGEAMLARGGMAAGLGRSLAADMTMGAANAAGAADRPDQSRALNALAGAGVAGAGSLAGNALVRGVSRAVAPTGGAVKGLYEAGVDSMTPGQRFANSGPVGRMVNTVEQKLQSLPVIGDMISGARQTPRDDFQIGAFNEALKEVGETLPKGMKPGTAPQAYAQKTFDRVYAEARKGMRMVLDDDLAGEMSALAGELSTLGPNAAAKFKAVVENHVTKRLGDGEMSGEMFKRTISDLGKWSARFRKGQTSEDQMLADAVESLSTALENAARRHSDPEAVALLDAADAGYAKLVRIEDAARRAGGEAGTFSPNQFDRAVQNTAGGVRSKSYLRGDALMQDFAQQGKNLSDTVPNSGTADRLAVTRLGLAALTAPIGVAYAPGVRKAMSAAMAPAGPGRTAIATQLKKRAALVGRTGAASAAASLPGTSPAQ